jgi:Protein of unknown function (DUF2490)
VKLLLTIAVFFTCIVSRAQDPAVEIWTSVSVPVFFGKNGSWQWHNDAGYRTNGMSVLPHQYLFRTGMRKFFNSKWNAAVGGALFFTRVSYNKEDAFGQENRLWQELVNVAKITEKSNLQTRFRVEERFFEAVENRTAFDAMRFRLRSAFLQTLNKNWQFQLSEEYMQQLANRNFQFNTNRIAAAMIRSWEGQSQLQITYILQTRKNSKQSIIALSFQKSIGSNGNN